MLDLKRQLYSDRVHLKKKQSLCLIASDVSASKHVNDYNHPIRLYYVIIIISLDTY